MRHGRAVFPLLDQFGGPVLPRRHHRQATGHRLQTDVGKRIAVGRQHKEVCRTVVGGHLGDRAGKGDRLGHAERLRLASIRGGAVFPGHDQMEGRKRGAEPGKGLNQLSQTFPFEVHRREKEERRVVGNPVSLANLRPRRLDPRMED